MRALTGIVVVCALMLLPSAAAQAKLPVGEAHGVRVVREHGAIVVIFTARASKLYKRIAGKRVEVSCTELQDDGTFSGSVTVRAPKHRGKLYTGDLTRGMDYCRVWLAARTVRRHGERQHRDRVHLVSVPLTQKGAVFIDEQFKAFDLFEMLYVASIVAERQKLDGYPTHAQMLDELPTLAGHLVALATPADAVPRGVIGYYSDGQKHAAVAILSASGRRLFIEYNDDVLSTNVAGYIYGDLD